MTENFEPVFESTKNDININENNLDKLLRELTYKNFDERNNFIQDIKKELSTFLDNNTLDNNQLYELGNKLNSKIKEFIQNNEITTEQLKLNLQQALNIDLGNDRGNFLSNFIKSTFAGSRLEQYAEGNTSRIPE